MNASTDPSVVLPSSDGGCGKALVRRTTAKPQQCFADAAALVGIKEQTKPDKKTADGARKTADEGQSTEDGAQEESVSSASVGCASPTAFIGPVESWCAVHAQRVQTPPASKEEPSDRVAQATGSRGAAHPEAAEAQVSKPVPAGIDQQAPQKAQKDSAGDATAIAQTEPGSGQYKEQVAGAGESAEKPQRARAGSDETPANKGSNAPFMARPLSADHSSVTMAKPDQTGPEDSSTSQDPAAKAPQGSRQGFPGLGSEGQPQTVSRREDALVGRGQPMGVIRPGDKNTVSGQRKNGAGAQAEPPASFVGQPAIVTPRPFFQTQIREVADVGTTQSPVRNVGEQILDSVRASVANGDKQVSIRLQPPELGTVTVRLREQGEHLEGTLEVGRSDTRRQIEQALPEVVRSLQDAGVPIRRFDVTSSDPPGQDLGRGLPQQDAWSGQQGSGQNRDHAPAPQTSWSRGASEYPAESHETSSSDYEIGTSRGRIDVLL